MAGLGAIDLGVIAAQKAGVPVETRPHPGGPKGSKMSLEEVAKRVWEGRNDPRLRGWAGRAIIAAGKPTSAKKRAQAILDALRKQTVYGADPVNTELMAKPHVTLCLDPNGVCIPIADCDDLVICFGSAALSVGIPTKVIGQAFNGEQAASHVIAAIEDDMSGWLRVDPSDSSYNVGQSHPACTKEWWLDPSETVHKSLQGHQDSTAGDFVGVGNIPWMGLPAYACPEKPNQLGGEPWMGLRAFCLGRGVGQSGGLSSGELSTLTGQLKSLVYKAETSRNNLGAALQKIQQTRIALRPDAPFDPEPATPITSIADFPEGNVWTQSMDAISVQLYDIMDRFAQFGHQALDGGRRILIDPNNQSAYFESKPDDPWGLHAVVATAQSVILGFFDRAGNLLSGVDARTGAALTAQQVQQAVQQQGSGPPPQGVGQGQIVAIVAIAAAVAVVAWAAVSIYGNYCDAATAKAESVTTDGIVQCISAGNCPPDMLQKYQQSIVAEKQAAADNAANNPFAKGLENLGTVFMWAAIGGIAVAGVVLLTPVVQRVFAAPKAAPAKNPIRRRRRR